MSVLPASGRVKIETVVTPQVREAFRARCRKAGKGSRAYLQELILRDMEMDVEGNAAPPEVIVVPEVPQPSAAPMTSVLSSSVVNLVARGFTPSQIAAMTRRPYREIMRELGREVDVMVKRGIA